MTSKITVVIEHDEAGYYAFCPEPLGCQSPGDSLDEAMTHFLEAIVLYLEKLSLEEQQQAVSKEVLTTSIEVQVAETGADDSRSRRDDASPGGLCVAAQ